MGQNFGRKVIGLLLAGLIIAIGFSPPVKSLYRIPQHIRIIEGEQDVVSLPFPFMVTVTHDPDKVLAVRNQKVATAASFSHMRAAPCKAQMEFRLLGIIPVRTVEVDVIPAVKVIPGGHSIGIIVHSQGVMVVGYSPVVSADGQNVVPAKEAAINIGDILIAINGETIRSDEHVSDIVNKAGQTGGNLHCLIKRNDQLIQCTIKPVLCPETNRYRIGLFVRDSAAGVGTLSFFEPNSKKYGALGHVITDNDTNQAIEVDGGKIVPASVAGIQYGKRGQPGEKIGMFIEEDTQIGNIVKNSRFGIYGKLSQILVNPMFVEPIPAASMTQVKLGAAEILTVVDGQNIDKFSVEVQKINLQDKPESKGLVLRITDPRLIEKTGGIVQGMSGSPIIQEGKLIGVVTHVFIHDPTRGYGMFIEWMLMENGIIAGDKATTVRKWYTLSDFFYKKV